MRIILVTGLSGAGKSLALKTFEDIGFEAVDNAPLAMLPALVATHTEGCRALAVGADIRGRDFSVEHFREALEHIRNDGKQYDVQVLFFDADDEVLCRRFSETRRKHPLAADRLVTDGIRVERDMLAPLRELADSVIDTSEYLPNDLRSALQAQFGTERQRSLFVSVMSFSYRSGLPREADLVFDVRFLKNPHYDPQLREKDGRDSAIGAYIEQDKDFSSFFSNLTALISGVLPRYMEEGKGYLTIAIGCTGGKHRSVYMVEKLGGFLSQIGYNAAVRHRDLQEILTPA